MNSIESIIKNKELIIRELYDWADSFDWELDEDGEDTTETYDYITDLATKLENNICDNKDYESILFHIGQINYNETRIVL